MHKPATTAAISESPWLTTRQAVGVIESPWMTKKQTAKYTHRSERSLDRDAFIPRHRIAGRVLFHRGEVDAALLAQPAK